MKFKYSIIIFCVLSIPFGKTLFASSGWINCIEVRLEKNEFYIDTNLGPVQLTVIDYDEENERYLVECIEYGEFCFPTPNADL